MAFREAGFFRELYDDDPELPSIRHAVRTAPHPEAVRITAYLEQGVGIAGVGKYVGDVLDPDSSFSISPGLATDGVWLWRRDLPHYVAVHHVALPEEFISHMRESGWRVPRLDESEVSRLSRQLYREMNGE